jgi:hypothetical protein
MKHYIILVSLILVGCATSDDPPARQKLVLDREVNAMSRNEVINAIAECEYSGNRPVMVYSKRKISNHTTDVVVDVTCAPRYNAPWLR